MSPLLILTNPKIHPTSFARRRVKTVTEFEIVEFIRQFSSDDSITVKARANFLILLKGIFQYAREKGRKS